MWPYRSNTETNEFRHLGEDEPEYARFSPRRFGARNGVSMLFFCFSSESDASDKFWWSWTYDFESHALSSSVERLQHSWSQHALHCASIGSVGSIVGTILGPQEDNDIGVSMGISLEGECAGINDSG